jgi:hypothetical protein
MRREIILQGVRRSSICEAWQAKEIGAEAVVYVSMEGRRSRCKEC